MGINSSFRVAMFMTSMGKNILILLLVCGALH